MYRAKETRYDEMKYNRCGNSGLKLPEVSLGFWHNFVDTGTYENMRQMALKWVLKDDVVTSVLIGASRPQQILDNIKVVKSAEFSEEEICKIDEITLGIE